MPKSSNAFLGIIIAAGIGFVGWQWIKNSGVNLFGSGSGSQPTSTGGSTGSGGSGGSTGYTGSGNSGSSGSSGYSSGSGSGSGVTVVGTVNPALNFYGCPMIQNGSQGIAVLNLQKALTALGINPASNQDGIFGPITNNAVRTFQSRSGISVDGIVGPQTYGALNTALRRIGGSWNCS